MIGPSSSHTLGALRISTFMGNLLGGIPDKVVFYLHQSFAETYKGHGTDRALLAGVLGISQDDRRVKEATEIAKKSGMDFQFLKEDLGEVHPNTVKIVAWKGKKTHEIWGSSVGAGMVKIIRINGADCELSGMYPTLIILNSDTPKALGMILSKVEPNVANLYLKRVNKLLSKAVSIIELDEEIKESNLFEIRSLPVVSEVYYVKSLVFKNDI